MEAYLTGKYCTLYICFRLFPTREHSNYNKFSKPLQQHEIEVLLQYFNYVLKVIFKEIMKDVTARARILRSYAMMLDFYGLKLKDEVTGMMDN